MNRHWYRFRAQSQGAEIAMYDEIGAFEIPAKTFLDWFTEGFESADVRDAKALLDELA
jgi:hypothetical protein